MSTTTEKRLTEKDINPTAMRLLVLDVLLQQNFAASLSDIEKKLRVADRITIYRTLKTFEGKGLVHLINDGTGSPKYALCLDECDAGKHQHLHVHFNCITCKETFCLPGSRIPEVLLPRKFSALEMDLVVKGICSKCAD